MDYLLASSIKHRIFMHALSDKIEGKKLNIIVFVIIVSLLLIYLFNYLMFAEVTYIRT